MGGAYRCHVKDPQIPALQNGGQSEKIIEIPPILPDTLRNNGFRHQNDTGDELMIPVFIFH